MCKRIEGFERLVCRRILNISWTMKISNQEVTFDDHLNWKLYIGSCVQTCSMNSVMRDNLTFYQQQ